RTPFPSVREVIQMEKHEAAQIEVKAPAKPLAHRLPENLPETAASDLRTLDYWLVIEPWLGYIAVATLVAAMAGAFYARAFPHKTFHAVSVLRPTASGGLCG